MPKPNGAPGKKPAALNAAHGDYLAKLWCGPGPRPKGEITAKGRGRARPGMKTAIRTANTSKKRASVRGKTRRQGYE
jgi:hypothetical protein